MDFATFLESAADFYRDEAVAHEKGTSAYNDAMAKFRDSVARSFSLKAGKATTEEGRLKQKQKAKLNRELRNEHARKAE